MKAIKPVDNNAKFWKDPKDVGRVLREDELPILAARNK